jgi:uncharacterized protein YjbI with pentapeptide repeats
MNELNSFIENLGSNYSFNIFDFSTPLLIDNFKLGEIGQNNFFFNRSIDEKTLKNIVFNEISFQGVYFNDCVFENLKFNNCSFQGVSFQNCTLKNCKFSKGSYFNFNFYDCSFDRNTTFPDFSKELINFIRNKKGGYSRRKRKSRRKRRNSKRRRT